MNSPYATFNRQDFPTVTITFTGEKETEENFSEYLKGLSQNYSSKETIAVIFDATNASTPNPKYQFRQATWLKENRQLMMDYCAGVAYVIKQPVIRTILGLIFKIQSQPCPYILVDSLQEAKNWTSSQLASK